MPKAYRRPSWRRPLTVLTVIAVLLAVGGYAAYKAYQHYVVQLLTVPGCQAGTGNNAIPLDFGQTADAATIAGVAVRQGLPRQALAIAYATALQEAKLENPSNGDLDSVGIFQQRPSEGWGSATQLQDPAYAATAFFNALVKVPDYTTLPVYQAAQDVQRSADGYAYEQYAQTGAALAAYFTATPHAVTCWYNPATQASNLGVSAKLDLKAAGNGLTDAFGQPGAGQRGPGDQHRPHRGVRHVQSRGGQRLGGGKLARRQCRQLRNHPGALRRVPVDGRADGNKLADRLHRRGREYCRQLTRRTTIL